MKRWLLILYVLGLSVSAQAGYMKASLMLSDGERPRLPQKVKAWFLWKDRIYLDSVILMPGDTIAGLRMPFQLVDSISTTYTDSVGWYRVNYMIIDAQGDTLFASDPVTDVGAVPALTWNNNYIAQAGRTVAGVTVSANNDKTGYRLSSTGIDDIWDDDSTGHLSPGSKMGYQASRTAASTLDSSTVAKAVGGQLHDSSVAMVGVGRIWQLRGLKVLGTSGNDTGVVIKGYGSGPGFFAMGGTTGAGLYTRGGITSGNAITAWTSNGHGLAVFGSADKAALYAEAIDSGQGAYFLGGNRLNGQNGAGSAFGMFIRGRADDALQLTAGDSATNKHAVEMQGGNHAGGDALRILGRGTSGMGVRVTTDDGIGIYAQGQSGHPGLMVDGGGRVTIDTVKFVDTVRSVGSAGGVTGTTDTAAILVLGRNHPEIFGGAGGGGAHAVRLTAFDEESHQVVPGVRLAVYNAARSALAALGATGPDGAAGFNLDSGSYIISSFAPGYLFSAYDTIIVSANMQDTVAGSRFDPGSPANPNLCRMYGFFYGIDGQPLADVEVEVQLADGAARYDNILISPYKKSVKSDSSGYFSMDLIPSDDLNPGGSEYLISASYPAGAVLKKKLTIPRSSGWQLTW
jgi:hypothetical protein